MMAKSKFVVVLAIVALAQLGVPLSMIARRERVLQHGESFKFNTAPVDPVDVFRGRYVWLNFDENSYEGEKRDDVVRGQKVHVTVGIGTNGFAQFTGVYTKPPADEPYITMRARYASGKTVHLDLPYDRYYMNERLAPAAERAYREHTRGAKRDAYAVVKVMNGFAVIDDLYVGGVPIVEYIRGEH